MSLQYHNNLLDMPNRIRACIGSDACPHRDSNPGHRLEKARCLAAAL